MFSVFPTLNIHYNIIDLNNLRLFLTCRDSRSVLECASLPAVASAKEGPLALYAVQPPNRPGAPAPPTSVSSLNTISPRDVRFAPRLQGSALLAENCPPPPRRRWAVATAGLPPGLRESVRNPPAFICRRLKSQFWFVEFVVRGSNYRLQFLLF